MIYSDLQRQIEQQLKEKEKADNECVTCPSCGSIYFESVDVKKFQLHHQVIVGQDIPEKPGIIPYKLLRCIRCSNTIEPRILHNSRDMISNDYDKFLDTMEGKNDKRDVRLQELSSEEIGELRELLKKSNKKKDKTNEVSDKK